MVGKTCQKDTGQLILLWISLLLSSTSIITDSWYFYSKISNMLEIRFFSKINFNFTFYKNPYISYLYAVTQLSRFTMNEVWFILTLITLPHRKMRKAPHSVYFCWESTLVGILVGINSKTLSYIQNSWRAQWSKVQHSTGKGCSQWLWQELLIKGSNSRFALVWQHNN